jgi:hypothetical protein
MARPRKENREEVASVAFNLRITLAEKHAIDRLVLHQEEQLRGMGIVAKASAASLVRTWIHAETKRTFGAFPLADEPQPDLPLELEVPMSAAPPPRDIEPAEVLAVARRVLDPHTGLVHVPAIVRAFDGQPLERVQAALRAASQAGMLELRPESGIGLLSKDDAALCPKGMKGVVLSYARIIEEEPAKEEPTADDTAAAPVDAEALRKRIKRALEGKSKRFDTAAELARAAGLGNNDVSRLKAGHGLAQDKLVKLDAALAGRGA